MKLRYKLPLIFALLLTAYLCITASLAVIFYPKPSVEPKDCFAEKMEIANIRRAARVNSGLYRGGLPGEEGLAALKKLGVKTIVDLHAHYENDSYPKKAEALGFNYVAMHLDEKPPSEEIVKKFLAIVADPDSCPVFVHCKRGKIRTSVLLAVYRMRCEGWTNQDAYDEMVYFNFNTFHRETFFFGSCAVHTDLADFVKNYRSPEDVLPEED